MINIKMYKKIGLKIMTRLVNHVRKSPYKVEKEGVTLWICGCGLSTNPPYCSGTHKLIKEESEGIYFYDLEVVPTKYKGEIKPQERFLE